MDTVSADTLSYTQSTTGLGQGCRQVPADELTIRIGAESAAGTCVTSPESVLALQIGVIPSTWARYCLQCQSADPGTSTVVAAEYEALTVEWEAPACCIVVDGQAVTLR